MKELLISPQTAAAVLTFFQNPSTYGWGLLFIGGLWVLSKVFASLAELVKAFK